MFDRATREWLRAEVSTKCYIVSFLIFMCSITEGKAQVAEVVNEELSKDLFEVIREIVHQELGQSESGYPATDLRPIKCKT